MAATLPDLETITLRRGASNGAELRIELNRPERMNAWDKQLGTDLLAAVELAAGDDGVRAVTITGAGRAFSSGADLRAGFDPTPDGRPDVGAALRERYHPIITGVRRMPKPVLAAVNGPAVGIGCSLALACDIVLAAESAYFLLGVREHRPRARRRLVRLRAGPRRRGARGRDGAAGRARARRDRERVGPGRPAGLRRLVRSRGRRAGRAARHGPDARVRRRPRRSSTRACTPGSTSSSSWRPRCSSRWPDRRTSGRASWPSSRSARRGSRASERSRPDSQYTALPDGPPPPDRRFCGARSCPSSAALLATRGAGGRGADPAGGGRRLASRPRTSRRCT